MLCPPAIYIQAAVFFIFIISFILFYYYFYHSSKKFNTKILKGLKGYFLLKVEDQMRLKKYLRRK